MPYHSSKALSSCKVVKLSRKVPNQESKSAHNFNPEVKILKLLFRFYSSRLIQILLNNLNDESELCLKVMVNSVQVDGNLSTTCSKVISFWFLSTEMNAIFAIFL